jgi:hypothetical protein
MVNRFRFIVKRVFVRRFRVRHQQRLGLSRNTDCSRGSLGGSRVANSAQRMDA